MPSSTSPSPPPPAPTPLTPGPRATAFDTLYSNALAATLNAISYPSFASCFPSISVSAPSALQAMHTSLVSRLEGFARDEFEIIMQERKVVERLNGLEDVIADGRRRKGRGVDDEVPVPPHTLPPPHLLQTHLSPLHTQQQSQLNAKLQTTASQNASLAAEINEQRLEIEGLTRLAEMLVRDLEGSGQLISEGGEGEELSRRAREAEGILGKF